MEIYYQSVQSFVSLTAAIKNKFLKKIKEKIWMQVIIIYTRYLLGGAFVFASLIKIKGQRFTTESGAVEPINSSWHFFETMYQSGLYWKFIGLGQLLAGFLLMTQRFSKLGALINFPILANIFAVTISYYFAFTPLIVAAMLLANLALIFWEWDELKILFNLKYIPPNYQSFEKRKVWEIVGVVLFIFTFLYRLIIDQYNVGFWFSICFLIGTIGLVIGIKQNKKI